jgi:hypothetical protein
MIFPLSQLVDHFCDPLFPHPLFSLNVNGDIILAGLFNQRDDLGRDDLSLYEVLVFHD